MEQARTVAAGDLAEALDRIAQVTGTGAMAGHGADQSIEPALHRGRVLGEAVKAHTGGAPIRLGLDAVSGQATARLASCVAEGGVVCNYGSMTGEDPVMARSQKYSPLSMKIVPAAIAS